jgi:hypothetical protein
MNRSPRPDSFSTLYVVGAGSESGLGYLAYQRLYFRA